MNEVLLCIGALVFLMLATFFFHIYFCETPEKRRWLSFWYGICFTFISAYMFMYMLLKGVIK